MHGIHGVIFHFIGGLASGSFYNPYKKVEKIIGGIFSWLIVASGFTSSFGALIPPLYRDFSGRDGGENFFGHVKESKGGNPILLKGGMFGGNS